MKVTFNVTNYIQMNKELTGENLKQYKRINVRI